ncbi:coiled-coil domain-containing protein [Thalassotalea hakodatensis]|uniref:hypothetical protein n=1 Tax=Thalassotalea hakodatensis TaxID=3030492 RepID=UPI002573D261|nr:hypothetical protein [Thalassotalea hakodatensis]
MSSNILPLDLPTNYELLELIFINSGSNYYSRIPLDTNAALFAGNNEGKTSSLAALKLFLLPEVNFKNCEDKFGFESGGKYFSNLDSFKYYFPSTESYIICNAKNPKGNFCWVLFRTTDLGYQRIAVPTDYGNIEHLFWNGTSIANEGAGQLQPNINITEVKKTLQNRDYKGVLFTDKQSIGEAIYTRTSSDNNHTRFSLLPMANKYTLANVETVRALVGMAFSLADASTTTLPRAIGNMIDGRGMSVVKDDGIIVDITDALNEFDELKEIESYLSTVRSNQPVWQKLKDNNKLYQEHREKLATNFTATATQVAMYEKKLKSQHQDLSRQAAEISPKVTQASTEAKEAGKTLSGEIAKLKSFNEQFEECNEKIQLAENARARLAPLCDNPTDSAIICELEEEIRLCQRDIDSLNSEETAQALVKSHNKTIQDNNIKLNNLKNALLAIENNSDLFGQLSSHGKSVLQSLNKGLAEVSCQLTKTQKNTIESFTDLFGKDKEFLTICERTTPIKITEASAEEAREQLIKQIDELDDKQEQLSNEMRKNAGFIKMTKDARSAKLTELSKELEELNTQKEAYTGCAALISMRDSAKEKIAALKVKVSQSEGTEKQAEAHHKALKEKHDKLQIQVQTILNNLQSLNSYIQNLQSIANESYRSVSYESISTTVNESPELPPFQENIVSEEIQSLSSLLIHFRSSRQDVFEGFQSLLRANVINVSVEEKNQFTLTKDAFETYYSSLESVFENISAAEEKYQLRLNAHNNNAATSARIIENVKDIIESEITGINTELAEYKISNLEKVQIKAELHPQYLDMIKSISRYTSVTDNLISEEFYKQISAFQNQFYIRKSSKINIPKIIESVSYEFDRGNGKEDVPQSNGTNSMINAVMLAQLLKRLVPEDLKLTMPVIFDEVGKLDSHNLKEVLKAMQENGLILFAANPAPTGVIVNVLEVSHDLSIFKATDVDVHHKAEAIYFPGMEERLEATSESNIEEVVK